MDCGVLGLPFRGPAPHLSTPRREPTLILTNELAYIMILTDLLAFHRQMTTSRTFTQISQLSNRKLIGNLRILT